MSLWRGVIITRVAKQIDQQLSEEQTSMRKGQASGKEEVQQSTFTYGETSRNSQQVAESRSYLHVLFVQDRKNSR